MLRHFPLIATLLILLMTSLVVASEPELISVEKIWDQGEHNAFTGYPFGFRTNSSSPFESADRMSVVFGKIRVLFSKDGDQWTSVALVEEAGVDLRDRNSRSTQAIDALQRALFNGTKILKSRRPRVSISQTMVLNGLLPENYGRGDWLWRVTWYDGVGYGSSRIQVPTEKKDRSHEKIASLYKTTDGRHYEKILTWDISGNPNETTLRFMPDGEMLALVRQEADDQKGWIGRAQSLLPQIGSSPRPATGW
ncbi:MAG: hypothetical protein R3C11_28085 [Planctomycetaceae bacterium]